MLLSFIDRGLLNAKINLLVEAKTVIGKRGVNEMNPKCTKVSSASEHFIYKAKKPKRELDEIRNFV